MLDRYYIVGNSTSRSGFHYSERSFPNLLGVINNYVGSPKPVCGCVNCTSLFVTTPSGIVLRFALNDTEVYLVIGDKEVYFGSL